ncbi:MAG: carboxypeptidase-like regulatory domain-containing protein, partial [Candidatus Omnitrophica bacterium]|nr:carboxypeptidase-like regulatory domain-containing protein [Candidatus Omnitrophota bacterium]
MFSYNKRINAHSFKILSLILFFCFVFVPPSFAALTTVITGRVIDSVTQKPISQASLKVNTLAGKTLCSALTDANGNYQISYLLAGHYQLACQASGYKPAAIKTTLIPNIFRRSNYVINFSLTFLNIVLKITSITPADRTSFTTEDTKITSIT